MNTVIDTPNNVLGVMLSGTVTEQDIKQIGKLIRGKISADETFGLVIDMTHFEDMTSDAMKNDVKLELSLAKQVEHFPKVAFISDKNWLRNLIDMASKLVTGTEVKTFASGELQMATDFAANLPEKQVIEVATITEMPTGRSNLMAFSFTGKLTEEQIHPFAEDLHRRLQVHDDIDLLMDLSEFVGFDLGIITDKSLYEMKKAAMNRVRRYAVVGAKSWMNSAAKTVAPFLEVEIRTFDAGEQAEALAWLDS